MPRLIYCARSLFSLAVSCGCHISRKVRNGFMEINPIVTKIKELRERTDALRGYL